MAEPLVIRQSSVVSEAEATSYFRNLAALHFFFALIPLGGLLAIAGAATVGGVLLFLGFAGWTLAITWGWLLTARKHRGKPWMGGDSIWAEANWWIGWGPIPEAASVTGKDAQHVKSTVRWAAAATLALWLLTFPVAALTT